MRHSKRSNLYNLALRPVFNIGKHETSVMHWTNLKSMLLFRQVNLTKRLFSSYMRLSFAGCGIWGEQTIIRLVSQRSYLGGWPQGGIHPPSVKVVRLRGDQLGYSLQTVLPHFIHYALDLSRHTKGSGRLAYRWMKSIHVELNQLAREQIWMQGSQLDALCPVLWGWAVHAVLKACEIKFE